MPTNERDVFIENIISHGLKNVSLSNFKFWLQNLYYNYAIFHYSNKNRDQFIDIFLGNFLIEFVCKGMS